MEYKEIWTGRLFVSAYETTDTDFDLNSWRTQIVINWTLAAYWEPQYSWLASSRFTCHCPQEHVHCQPARTWEISSLQSWSAVVSYAHCIVSCLERLNIWTALRMCKIPANLATISRSKLRCLNAHPPRSQIPYTRVCTTKLSILILKTWVTPLERYTKRYH